MLVSLESSSLYSLVLSAVARKAVTPVAAAAPIPRIALPAIFAPPIIPFPIVEKALPILLPESSAFFVVSSISSLASLLSITIEPKSSNNFIF